MNIRVDDLRHTWVARDLETRTVLEVGRWSTDAGEQILLRGVSGSGKTTLLNVLSGLLRPTAGSVWLDDVSLFSLNEAQRDLLRAQSVGYVYQSHLLVPTLNAVENVETPLVFAGGMRSAARRQRAMEWLEKVGMQEYARHRPVQLSTGQRLRISVACALVNHPRLVLADEPTAALDTDAGVRVIDLLQEVCREWKGTLIVASHDPSLSRRFGRVVDLRSGKLSEVLDDERSMRPFAPALAAVAGVSS